MTVHEYWWFCWVMKFGGSAPAAKLQNRRVCVLYAKTPKTEVLRRAQLKNWSNYIHVLLQFTNQILTEKLRIVPPLGKKGLWNEQGVGVCVCVWGGGRGVCVCVLYAKNVNPSKIVPAIRKKGTMKWAGCVCVWVWVCVFVLYAKKC